MVTFKVNDLKNMSAQLKAFAEFLHDSGATEDDIFASRLVSCELLTNVIRHGGDTAEFCGMLTSDAIIIRVSADSLKGLDLPYKAPDVFAESGRGLYIVKSFCGEIQRQGGELKVEIIRKK